MMCHEGRIAEAVEVFDKFVDADPSDVTVRRRLVLGLRYQGKVDEACEHAEALYSMHQESTSFELLELVLLERQQYFEVLQGVSQMEELLTAGDVSAAFTLQSQVLSSCLPDTHVATFKLEGIMCPTHLCSIALHQTGDILFRLGLYAEAANSYGLALSATPPAGDKVRLKNARALELSGAVNAAVLVYEDIISTSTLHPKVKPFYCCS
jgi:tetratricopeptide (TPR) repeat protein